MTAMQKPKEPLLKLLIFWCKALGINHRCGGSVYGVIPSFLIGEDLNKVFGDYTSDGNARLEAP